MAGLVRLTDKDDNHAAIVKASTTVVCDNLYAAKKDSMLSDGDSILTGSSSVNIENQPAAIIGSKTKKSHTMIQGSQTVFVGN